MFISADFTFCNREGTMLAMLELLETEYGGVDGYLRDQCGFSGRDIESIKGNLRMAPETEAMPIPE